MMYRKLTQETKGKGENPLLNKALDFIFGSVISKMHQEQKEAYQQGQHHR